MSTGLFAGSISREAKNFYTLGTVAASIILPALVEWIWSIARKLAPETFASLVWPFFIAIIVTIVTAIVIPEPEGFKDEGKLRLTLAEGSYGVIMSLILGANVIALDHWFRF